MSKDKEDLDIYIDETGDESPYSSLNPLYVVSFVCVPISEDNELVQAFLANKLSSLPGGDHFVHCGNLTRCEKPYQDLPREDRQKLFGALFFFAKRAHFSYWNAVLEKNHHPEMSFEEKVASVVKRSFDERKEFISSFQSITLHYDGGQAFLKGILAAISVGLDNSRFKATSQMDSPFMQVANLTGFMELLWYKAERGSLTASDVAFFGKKRKIKKDIMETLDEKKI